MTKTSKHCRLLILGSGPAGYSAAVYAARANLSPIVLTGQEIGGQIARVHQLQESPARVQITGDDRRANLVTVF